MERVLVARRVQRNSLEQEEARVEDIRPEPGQPEVQPDEMEQAWRDFIDNPDLQGGGPSKQRVQKTKYQINKIWIDKHLKYEKLTIGFTSTIPFCLLNTHTYICSYGRFNIYTAIGKVHTTFGWHEIRLGVGSVQGQDKGWW